MEHFIPRLSRIISAASILCALLTADLSEAAVSQVVLDLNKPRAEIRATLLKYTPLQTSTNDVVNFVSKHLQRTPNGKVSVADGPPPGIDRAHGAKFIRAYLGQYLDHPEIVFLSAPLISEREVTAFWIFDDKSRLLDVVVKKKSGIY